MAEDVSMRGPLNAAEQPMWDAWMVEAELVEARVPRSAMPEGSRGQWTIERFEVTEEDSRHLFRKDIRNRKQRPTVWTPPGIYTRLTTEHPTAWGWPGGEIMTDRLGELRAIADFLSRASGSILECGLGLGLFVQAAIAMPAIGTITVIEVEPDIIEMVGSQFNDPRLTIIEGDFRRWHAGVRRFDRAWIDTIQAHNERSVISRYQRCADQVCLYEPLVA